MVSQHTVQVGWDTTPVGEDGKNRPDPTLALVCTGDPWLPRRVGVTMDEQVVAIASIRYGLFTREHALRAGATDRIISTRLRTGRWVQVSRGVYRLAGVEESWTQAMLAACLRCGPGALASHRAATHHWGLAEQTAPPIELIVEGGRRPQPANAIVHRPVVPLPRSDRTTYRGIPVTTPARTLFDLAAVVPTEQVGEALDEALRRGLVTVTGMRTKLTRWRRAGIRGVATIEMLLRQRSDNAITESILETRFLRRLRQRGLDDVVPQYEVWDGDRLLARVDFAFPRKRIAIEVDGYRWHSGRNRWRRDLDRLNRLIAAGWRVVHVTAEQVGSTETLDMVRAIVR